MHQVVHFNIDSEMEQQIGRLWLQFVDAGITPASVYREKFTHVTIMSSGLFCTANLSKEFNDIASAIQPFEVTFSHLGIFSATDPILFLGVTPTDSLMKMHRRFFDLISPVAAVFNFARPDAFVFHCTLGSIKPKDLDRAIKLILLEIPLPAKTVVSGFDVVECGGTKQPERFRFGTL